MYLSLFFFFFTDTATTEIYTLSLHDALPICGDVDHPVRGIGRDRRRHPESRCREVAIAVGRGGRADQRPDRSEEHTSELQSRRDLVCRLLLEKKKTKDIATPNAQSVPNTTTS